MTTTVNIYKKNITDRSFMAGMKLLESPDKN
jgi:hypothetical protein